jgi:predicted MFS family arabinose efflux permease
VTHVSGAQLSCVLLIVGIAGFVGALIGRAIGERLHLTLATLPGMLAVVAVGLATWHSLPATGALLAIWGLVSTAAPVVWWTWVTRTAPNNAEAGGGLMVAVAQIGICAGAGGGGVIFDGYGPVATFIGSAVLLVVAALVALTIGGRSRVCGGARNDVCTSAHAVAP